MAVTGSTDVLDARDKRMEMFFDASEIQIGRVVDEIYIPMMDEMLNIVEGISTIYYTNTENYVYFWNCVKVEKRVARLGMVLKRVILQLIKKSPGEAVTYLNMFRTIHMLMNNSGIMELFIDKTITDVGFETILMEYKFPSIISDIMNLRRWMFVFL